jgi:UrcA family protein
MTRLRQLALTILGGAGLLLASTPVSAQQEEIVVTGKMQIPTGYESVKKVVSISGLDLSTSAGVSEMERRVGNAVQSICANPPPFTNDEKRVSKLCSDFAWASARSQMNDALQKARSR